MDGPCEQEAQTYSCAHTHTHLSFISSARFFSSSSQAVVQCSPWFSSCTGRDIAHAGVLAACPDSHARMQPGAHLQRQHSVLRKHRVCDVYLGHHVHHLDREQRCDRRQSTGVGSCGQLGTQQHAAG